MSVLKDIREDLEKGAVKLITEYRDRLFAEAVRLCSDRSSAEDLVSRTFIRVLSNIDRQTEYDNLFAWMKTVMLNIHRNDLKRPVARGTLPVEAEELEKYAGADNRTIEEIMLNSDKDALRIALDRLDPEYRQVVSMYYFSELSLKDIACLLHSSTSSISRRLQTARKILAAKLNAVPGKKTGVVLGALLLVGAAFASWTTGFFGLLPDSEPEAPASEQSASEQTVEETVLTNDVYQTTKEEKQMKTNSMKMTAAVVAGVSVLGAHADGIVGEIMPDDALEFVARQTENGYLYVDELGRTNAVEIFLSSGSWTIPDGVKAFDYLVVGGGGSGAGRYGGGGGAGGLISGTVILTDALNSREMTIAVGTGGASVTGSVIGKKGEPSSISAIVDSTSVKMVEAYGGGAGLNSNNASATDIHGGSGGGGSFNAVMGGRADAGCVYSAYWIFGEKFANEGGLGTGSTDFKGGGGGGAGENGASFVLGGKGGDGIETFITGKSAWFAGGGGGAKNSGEAAPGGKGGGGAGCVGSVLAESGKPNTGSGGGGEDAGAPSGAGGSGIVIIRHRLIAKSTDPVSKCSLTVKPSKGGKVAGMGAGSYDKGSFVILVAEPKSDYKFGCWKIDGVVVSEDESLVIELTSDVTLVAEFVELPLTHEWGWLDERNANFVVVAFTNDSMGAIVWEIPGGVKKFDYVVVGGGGSGGSRYGGGGGAGGVITGTVASVKGFTSRQLSITVGAGGVPVTGQNVGKAGKPSEIVATVASDEVSLVKALGGGAGWRSNTTIKPDFNNNGGSGGGGSFADVAGGTADAGSFYSADWIAGVKFANAGGKGPGSANYTGGGGGGAGEAGSSVDEGSKGGDGVETFITGKSLWLAGGGGGAKGNGGADFARGGKGGGGDSSGVVTATSGVANTGSGGGGLAQEGSGRYSGAGGSGIVIIRYKKPPKGFAVIVF